MVIKKTETGRWQVDVQPGGRGAKRVKKTFDNKAEATQWEIHVKSSVNKNAEWVPEKKDMRKLSELINFWNKHHGKNLKAGDDTYSRLLNMSVYLKDPIASNFTASHFLKYREERIEAGVSKNTMNHEHAYLRSVFNELIRVGEWNKENPDKRSITRKFCDMLLRRKAPSAPPAKDKPFTFPDFEPTEIQTENMLRLVELVTSNPEKYSKDYPVELAELFRELGKFNEAIYLLQNISTENQDMVTGLILKMAIEKHTAPIRYRH